MNPITKTHHDSITKMACLFLLGLMISCSIKINSTIRFPFPPFNQLLLDISKEFTGQTSYQRPLGSEGGFRDLAGVLLGMRRMTANIGWISVLQYYGSHESSHDHSERYAFGGGHYPSLKNMVLRVVRLDPSFHFAYLYGAGSLAFNLDRPNEAIELLEEGIRRNPQYWRFHLYVGAIVYKQKGRFDMMIALLEDAIKHSDCPVMIKSILANIYKERKNHREALRIWLNLFEMDRLDPWYREQAERNIKELTEAVKNEK